MNGGDLIKMWRNMKWVNRDKKDLTKMNYFYEMRWNLETWEILVHEREMNFFTKRMEYQSTSKLMCRPLKVMCRDILKCLIKNRKINSIGRPIHECVDTSWSIFGRYKQNQIMRPCVDALWTKLTFMTYEMIFYDS